MDRTAPGHVIAVTGLRFEARIAGRASSVLAVSGAGEALADAIRNAASSAVRGIVSFGIAGALDPGLKPGDILIASAVVDRDGQQSQTHLAWQDRLAGKIGPVHRGHLYGSGAAITTADEKASLFARTRCQAVDMESHIAARVAAELGIPFAILRVIADDAASAIPPAALKGMGPDGKTDALAVIGALAHDPKQVKPLIRLAAASNKARSVLSSCVGRLGPGLGCVNLG